MPDLDMPDLAMPDLGMSDGGGPLRPHFHIGRIPVRIEPAFIVVIAILGLDPYDLRPVRIFSWLAVVTVSVLVHELGHAVAFRAYGLSPRITLQGFGGLTSAEGALSPGRHILVSLAGPLGALVLLGLSSWWLKSTGDYSGDAALVLGQIMWVNIGWSLLNLMPILPLDGGHVVESVLEIAIGGRGRRIARIISVAVAGVVGVLAIGSGLMFGALLAAMFLGMNLTELSKVKAVEAARSLEDAQRALLDHRPAEADAIIDRVMAKKPSGSTLRWAAELSAWSRLWQGDSSGATKILERYSHAGAPSACFRAAEALVAGRIDEGVSVMAWAFMNDPNGPAKSLGAVAAAGVDQAEAVATELMLIGGTGGTEAARLLAALLDYAGYHVVAARVSEIQRSFD